MIPRRAFVVPVAYTIAYVFVAAFVLIAAIAAGPRACAQTVLDGEDGASHGQRSP